MFLLAYSLDAARWQDSFPEFDQERDLLQSIIPAFSEAVRRATTRGIHRGYEERSEILATIRGRVEFDQMIKRRYGILFPVDCRFDEFTEDIELNRLLLAAARSLQRLRRLDQDQAHDLRAVAALFGRVSSVRYSPRDLPSVSYTRLTRHYRLAVELALLILRSRTTEIGAGGVRARGFFVDMAQVFEDFVVTALREALRLSEYDFPQGARGKRLRLDLEGAIRLKPDFSWWEGGQCRFVGDVKYKTTPETAGVKEADIYQLLAYAQAADLPSGLLVYAKGDAEPRSYSIVNSDRVFLVRTLDLEMDPADVLDQISRIAAQIRLAREPGRGRVLDVLAA